MKTITVQYNKNGLSRLLYPLLGLGLAMTLFQGCDAVLYSSGTGTYQTTTEVYHPDWAPAYDNNDQARYYYLPDIETYYDLRAREFICLEDGNWVFTSILPYASFDIHNAFVVVLDSRVSQPWHHHQLYVSHYPRYYYRTVYNSPRNTYTYHDMRGFNENGKKNIFRNNYSGNTVNSNQRQYQNQPINNRSTSTGRQNNTPTSQQNTRTSNQQQNNRTSTQQQDNRTTTSQQQNNNRTYGQQPERTQSTTEQSRQQNNTSSNRNQSTETNTQGNQRSNSNQQSSQETSKTQEDSRRSQPAEYRGRTIGKPVKVQRDMKIQKETESKDSKKKGK